MKRTLQIPALRYGFFLALLIWGFQLFKQVEPIIYPVITDFHIREVIQNPPEKGNRGSTLIAGTLTKKRDCTFIETIVVTNGVVGSIEYQETAYNSTGVVSRPVGNYDFGWWALVPAVEEMRLYSRHACLTGDVLTVLYEGRL